MGQDWTLMDVSSLEELLVRRWDEIAEDYYSGAHPTTRNFDAVIDAHLPRYLHRLSLDGYVLEIGGGRGRLAELVTPRAKLIVIGDISTRMMKAGRAETARSNTHLQMSAFHCPFRDDAFDAVISILGDSFARQEAFVEFYRTLKSGGGFVVAAPSAMWGRTLRRAIGVPMDETVLFSRACGELRVSSFLYDETELEEQLSRAGFEVMEIRSFDAVGVIHDVKDFSEHVVLASQALKLSPRNVPLITIALGFKR